ncbi:hypothetical protein BaRGS_00011883 [Batillaria attramentaria]|uniref:Uncharacterized protein n=1 Tax=Batillaria attramentaria TaxID=370345 RepID=A0ABD0LC81_9CAEN
MNSLLSPFSAGIILPACHRSESSIDQTHRADKTDRPGELGGEIPAQRMAHSTDDSSEENDASQHKQWLTAQIMAQTTNDASQQGLEPEHPQFNALSWIPYDA